MRAIVTARSTAGRPQHNLFPRMFFMEFPGFLIGAALIAVWMYSREAKSVPSRLPRLWGAVGGALLLQGAAALGLWLFTNWPFPWSLIGAFLAVPAGIGILLGAVGIASGALVLAVAAMVALAVAVRSRLRRGSRP